MRYFLPVFAMFFLGAAAPALGTDKDFFRKGYVVFPATKVTMKRDPSPERKRVGLLMESDRAGPVTALE